MLWKDALYRLYQWVPHPLVPSWFGTEGAQAGPKERRVWEGGYFYPQLHLCQVTIGCLGPLTEYLHSCQVALSARLSLLA